MISAKQNTDTPTVIEFIIDREINVMPIVPPGNALNDMILDGKGDRDGKGNISACNCAVSGRQSEEMKTFP